MIYRCKLTNSKGSIIEKRIVADHIEELYQKADREGLTLLSYCKIRRDKCYQLTNNEILIFTQSLELLLSSGFTILDGLEIALTTFKDSKIISFTKELIERLKKGDAFNTIVKESNAGFTPLYIGLIDVGERTGRLNLVLKQLYGYLDREKKFRESLISALTYPCFIFVITTLFSLIFILVILPKFNTMFTTLGSDISSRLSQRGAVLAILIMLSLTTILAITLTVSLCRGKKIEGLYLKLPIIGTIILQMESSNLIFALAVLTGNALTIEEALEGAKNVLNNTFLRCELDTILQQVMKGDSLSHGFSKTIFPKRIASFIEIGERTGDINRVFNNLSNYYIEESNKRTKRYLTLMDPLFTLITGGSLFILILIFIQPLLTTMGDLL